MNKKFWGIVKKFVALSLVAALALSNPISVEAKTKKKTLKYIDSFTTDFTTAESLATPVAKGTYKFKIKAKGYDAHSYIKFTAPATKQYTLTLSKLKSASGRYSCGFFDVMRANTEGEGLTYVPVTSNAPMSGSNGLHFASSKSRNKCFPTKRTAKFDLQEGETVYIYFDIIANGKSVSFDYKIK